MADLPTNYLDDILSDSMGGKRRFKITHLNGTSEEVTIEDISKYDQVGSTFGAGDINKTNQAVNEKFDSDDVVDPMLTTEEGFAADAKLTGDALIELNKKKVIYYETITVENVINAPSTTTSTNVPFDITGKQMHSLEVQTTGFAGIIPQGIYYHESSRNVVVTCYNATTTKRTANLSVIVRYSFL